MMHKSVIVGMAVVGILAFASHCSRADDDDYNPAAVGRVLAEASVPLEQGLKASERDGKPISAKYEIEDGALQLSVYTVKEGKVLGVPVDFLEVIVDHKSGTIKKAGTITDAEDLEDATKQNLAMAKAKLPLSKAVESAVRANGGYRAVRAVPTLAAGVPVAAITLMKGEEVKNVTEKLD